MPSSYDPLLTVGLYTVFVSMLILGRPRNPSPLILLHNKQRVTNPPLATTRKYSPETLSASAFPSQNTHRSHLPEKALQSQDPTPQIRITSSIWKEYITNIEAVRDFD
jgi:hypothetical protein